MSTAWWRDAVCYEIYVRSFADGNGDGVGDLPGIRSRLRYLADLGIDALWLTPFYPSPQADHGYDVADYRDVDPRFGTLADFDALLADAHALGLRVTVDLVPNHTSDRHPWFQAALAAGRGSRERARYLFRDGRGRRGERPPNNWHSQFGGPAWTRVPDGQWYLHLFTAEQPDLDWRHPDVPADFERTLRFWLDRGVDGFRIDVAHSLFKDPALPDLPNGVPPDLMASPLPPSPMWNQPQVHQVYRDWRRLVDGYRQQPAFVGEVWLGDPAAVAPYVRGDELHLAFNFRLLFAPWQAAAIRGAIEQSLQALGEVGAPPTWVLSNHDVVRHVTRYGGGVRGLRRAGAALLLLLALPGPVFLYAGEELGLPEVDLPDEALQDPVWERTGHLVRGRDGCRVPLPWSGTAPPYGFAPPGVQPWLPMPPDWGKLTVAAQQADGSSPLALYRAALRTRRAQPALGAGELRWLPSPAEALFFERPARGGGPALICALNLGARAIRLPSGSPVLASEPGIGSTLPPDTAVWLHR